MGGGGRESSTNLITKQTKKNTHKAICISDTGCGNRLGMESGFIADHQISSPLYEWQGPDTLSRLHYPNGCWIPSSWGDHHWIQVGYIKNWGGGGGGGQIRTPIVPLYQHLMGVTSRSNIAPFDCEIGKFCTFLGTNLHP